MNTCGTYGPSVATSLIPIQTRDREDFHGHLFTASHSRRNLLIYRKRRLLLLPHQVRPPQYEIQSSISGQKKRLFLNPMTTMPLMLCSTICNPANHAEWCLWVFTGNLRRCRWLLKVMGRCLCTGEHSLRIFPLKDSAAISQTVELYVHGLLAYLRHH